MEPMTLGAASGTAGLFSGFYQHFKPARSPYLLGGILCVGTLVYVSGKSLSLSSFLLIFFPLALTFALLSVLCFYFDPKKSLQETDIHKVSETIDEKEVDEQYKFSRTLCLSGGIFWIGYLFSQIGRLSPAESLGPIFWVTYVSILVHIVIFVAYVTFRNIQEERTINLSLFQITFFTIAVISAIVVLGARITSEVSLRNESLLYGCGGHQVQYVTDEKTRTWRETAFGCDEASVRASLSRIGSEIKEENPQAEKISLVTAGGTQYLYLSKTKLLYWYFFIFLIVFEYFWLKRLKNIVQVRVIG